MNDWIKDATAADPDEVARLNPALPDSVNEGVRLDTASTEAEAQALHRRLRQIEPAAGRSGWSWAPVLLGGGLLVAGGAAAAVAMIAVPQVVDTVVDDAPTAMLLRAGVAEPIGPSVVVTGLGELSVDRLHDRGADVSLVDGVARFEVDPNGTARNLIVSAAGVDVEVMGTVFTVQRLGDEVAVDVERGKVSVSFDGATEYLLAGQSWRKGEGLVSADAVPTDLRPDPGQVEGVDEPEVPVEPASGTAIAEPVVVESRPAAAAPPRVSSAPSASSPVVEKDPCEVDMFSPECASARVRARPTSPRSRYEALVKARIPMSRNDRTARSVVQDCNTFLNQYGDTEFAADVYAIRVEASFYGERASQVIKYADAYLAAVDEGHSDRAKVAKWRNVASLRQHALDSAQKGEYGDALPLWRDLVSLESGRRKEEAKAWQGVSAASIGAKDEARRVLSTVREEDLTPILRAKVREAWVGLTDAPRERVRDPR